jgi:uncharacterized protein YyaL (SSP411 family)
MALKTWLRALILLGAVGAVLGVLSRVSRHPGTEAVRAPSGQEHRATSMTAGSASSSSDAGRTPNRLIHERSPYLQQHAYNPVEWYPWGEEAFAKASREQKPIFLSIGYSTCHWCHVMERESFEDPEVAKLLNQWFVSIKVDREEHPDVDQVYMQAVQAMTGHGGWPLTVFLTPDLKPFFGGTYFPAERRHNVPGMNEILPAVAQAWNAKREDILSSAGQLTGQLQQLATSAKPGTVAVETLHQAFNQATTTFDPTFGGFGGAPKFPQSHALSFLLHYWARSRATQSLEIVTTTLEHLARGGIHDHLGGGFHRYSTDEQWLVPHFEKMLYDQALLARTYVEAYQVTRASHFADVARGIFDYVLRDMTHPDGAFYAAEDADSEGQEGTFYVWRPEEILEALGPEEGELVNRFYGVTAEGNFEHGTSILHIAQPLEAFAKLKDHDPVQLAHRLAGARQRLLAVRAHRVRPHRDEKILTSWNGLMIASFAYGAAALDEPRYLRAAEAAAQFLLTHLRQRQQLFRRWRDGQARYPGTLEDYAFFSDGLLELYEASLEPRYLAEAKALVLQMIERFWDEEGGGFFLRGKQEEPLIVSAKEFSDGAIPSGNSMAALALFKLGRLTADERLESYGRRLLEASAEAVNQAPLGYAQSLIAWDLALGPTREIVVAGDPEAPQTRRMLQVVHQQFLPRTVLALHGSGKAGGAIEALIPFLKAQQPLDGKPTAYVCENYACKLPATSPEQLAQQLAGAAQSPARPGAP